MRLEGLGNRRKFNNLIGTQTAAFQLVACINFKFKAMSKGYVITLIYSRLLNAKEPM
jgi:hypothetical protein